MDCDEVWENERTPTPVRLFGVRLHSMGLSLQEVVVVLEILGHDVADTKFLVDGAGYLTALARRELSGQLNYSERNHIETWFQTVSMRIDRFHSFWRGS